MDIPMLIRSVIFLVPGLALIFYPKKVVQFQEYVLGKLGFNSKIKDYERPYKIMGLVFVIIAIGLFGYAVW